MSTRVHPNTSRIRYYPVSQHGPQVGVHNFKNMRSSSGLVEKSNRDGWKQLSAGKIGDEVHLTGSKLRERIGVWSDENGNGAIEADEVVPFESILRKDISEYDGRDAYDENKYDYHQVVDANLTYQLNPMGFISGELSLETIKVIDN